jgi:hypothetical protein
MNDLPPAAAYRLALFLGRERQHIEDQMVEEARALSPIYAFMPTIVLRQWGHDMTGAVITTLVEGDLAPLRNYGAMAVQVARRVGRSPDLVRALIGTWSRINGALAAAAFAADPPAQAETRAILQTLLGVADEVITAAYADYAARELLQNE